MLVVKVVPSGQVQVGRPLNPQVRIAAPCLKSFNSMILCLEPFEGGYYNATSGIDNELSWIEIACAVKQLLNDS